ncbi:MAG: signal peptidase I [Candidatus Electrothrix sp. AR1]|nr:signal peptidase I [Candidatus Electrothrix sp. AR1]
MLFIITVSVALFFFFFFSFLLLRKKILLIVFIVAYSAILKFFIVQAYKMPSGSMLPNILIGDHFLANKYIYKFSRPSHGDIAIFPFPKAPNLDYIKRVIALGGDTVEIKNKVLFVNEKKIIEPYANYDSSNIIPSSESPRDFFGPITVPNNKVFVLGDNRDNSFDSRFWGFVNEESINARMEFIYWSKDKKKEEVRWNRIGKSIK